MYVNTHEAAEYTKNAKTNASKLAQYIHIYLTSCKKTGLKM